jgi:aryl-alcohol dehydrogenase-like predicted oxidoreductase
LARAKGRTPAQLALAWLLTRGDHVIPIPGSTRIERVEENAGATRVNLTAEDIRALDALAPTVAGERYPEGGMRAVNR